MQPDQRANSTKCNATTINIPFSHLSETDLEKFGEARNQIARTERLGRPSVKAFVRFMLCGICAIVMHPALGRATNIQSVSCAMHTVSISTASVPYNQPRLTVSCVTPNNGIPHYACPLLSNNAALFQALAALISAQGNANQVTMDISSKWNPILITYDDDDKSGNNWGCGSANCRTILSVDVL
jgi:hypothetical protein